ncbi:hypothetical protein COCMIDRAFT_41095 [Bipolaris oryzae ATCC 44560]|uniref:FAD/NAD(P)-binding domain-containing protein n=1 Tax=Bipolaris oryzae ATCC 44560 TaxID=930090 RepID=W6ZA61_COCMI|nr:uncharacterized protein COCMIDRAFT_41095 [Bipolaris oryzae ATCC 44560]EUC40601.1 hypothetical protein COCMIDRAFT_41095 [Bipolaris oryzae ATCC 44560]
MSFKSRLEAVAGHINPPKTTPTIVVEDEVLAKEPSPEFPQNQRTIFPPLELEEHSVDDVRSLRVAIVGAGISGIFAGILPRGAEIKICWKRIMDNYELVNKYIRLKCRVDKTEWSEEKGRWLVTVASNGKILGDAIDFLVIATGHFADPRLLDHPGRDEYEGHLLHSSNWDETFDPAGKRIANLAQYVADNIDKARTSPDEYLKFRKELEAHLFSRFGAIFKGDRTDLFDSILPDFAPSCRQLTPGPGYLEALTAGNVDYVIAPIEKFTRISIQTVDGKHREVDAIICSTGHDVSFSTAFPIYANGIEVQAVWRPGGDPGFPDSYLGFAAPKIPNLVTMFGANATGPVGTLCHAVLRKISSQGIRSLAPTVAVTRHFRAYCESFFPRKTMSEYSSLWYNGGIKGDKIHGLWPGSAAHVAFVRRESRWEDFEYTYISSEGN